MATSAIVYTKDLDDAFFPALKEIAADLDASPRDMLCVMMAESGVLARAHNPNGHASGLIQFMPAILKGLKWTEGHEAFRQLSATEQLPFVRRYFLPHAGKLRSVAAIYVATFLPALLNHAHKSHYVLVAKSGQLGWAYSANAGFDVDKNYEITVHELGQAVIRACRGPRWNEIMERLTGEMAPIDVTTTIGLQRALAKLGFDPGPLDGIPGPKTRAAVVAFQTKNGSLAVDGIPGPLTRAALGSAIAYIA